MPPPTDTATKLETKVLDLPLSVSVVSGRLAAEQAGLVLGDALKNASGVNVGTGFGLFDYFVVRGFDSLETGLVLVDGAPDLEAPFYPLYNVQQVDVLKGPGAFAWGGSALGSAVQVVRKHPVAARFADVTLAYGKYGTYEAAGDVNLGSADGKRAFRLNAVVQGTNGYRDGRDGTLGAFNPTFLWRPDDRTRVGLSYEYLSNNQSPDSGLPYANGSLVGPSRQTSFQSASDFSEQDAHRARFDAERRLNDTFLLRDKLYFGALDWASDGTLLVGAFPFPDGNTYAARTQGLLDDRQRLYGNQLELVASFHTGSVAHELVTGLELSRMTDVYTQDAQLVQPLDVANPVEFDVGIYPIPLPQAHQAGDSTSRVLAPYLIDRISFSPKFQLVAGARLDDVHFEDTVTVDDARRLAREPAGRARVQAGADGLDLRERQPRLRAALDPGRGPARSRGEPPARGGREGLVPGGQGLRERRRVRARAREHRGPRLHRAHAPERQPALARLRVRAVGGGDRRRERAGDLLVQLGRAHRVLGAGAAAHGRLRRARPRRQRARLRAAAHGVGLGHHEAHRRLLGGARACAACPISTSPPTTATRSAPTACSTPRSSTRASARVSACTSAT